MHGVDTCIQTTIGTSLCVGGGGGWVLFYRVPCAGGRFVDVLGGGGVKREQVGIMLMWVHTVTLLFLFLSALSSPNVTIHMPVQVPQRIHMSLCQGRVGHGLAPNWQSDDDSQSPHFHENPHLCVRERMCSRGYAHRNAHPATSSSHLPQRGAHTDFCVNSTPMPRFWEHCLLESTGHDR